MKIKAKTFKGEEFEIKGKKNDTVEELKKKIESKSKISKDDQILVFKGVILKNEQKVSDCGLKDGSVIQLIAQKKSEDVEDDRVKMEVKTFNEIVEKLSAQGFDKEISSDLLRKFNFDVGFVTEKLKEFL